ncbi:hypothetical protein ACXO9X_04570 [Lactobacillus delbrueckii subsp. bulgaricus]
MAKRPLKLQDLNEKALKAGDWQIAITCCFDDFAIKKSFDLKQYLEESDSFAEEAGTFSQLRTKTGAATGSFQPACPCMSFLMKSQRRPAP